MLAWQVAVTLGDFEVLSRVCVAISVMFKSDFPPRGCLWSCRVCACVCVLVCLCLRGVQVWVP
jgi:hypothetical protein